MVCARREIQLTIVRVPLMRVSDHRLGDYDLETGDRLPFLRPDKIKGSEPGKCPVVADVSEEWVTPVDTRMEALGGVVFRTARQNVQDDQRAEMWLPVSHCSASHSTRRRQFNPKN
jgi:hypothetical protein